jgi:hypothetical protein
LLVFTGLIKQSFDHNAEQVIKSNIKDINHRNNKFFSGASSGKPKRSTAGRWLGGPSNNKAEYFMTAQSRIRSNVQKQALMIESQGIDITEEFMTTAKQQVYENTIQEVNNPHGLFEVEAMKASLKQALQMKPRRQTILKSIEAEINNLERSGVLSPIRYRNIPKEYSKDI